MVRVSIVLILCWLLEIEMNWLVFLAKFSQVFSRGSYHMQFVHSLFVLLPSYGRMHMYSSRNISSPKLTVRCWNFNCRYLVTTLKVVPRGTEGAVSVEGTSAGLFASILLASIACLTGQVWTSEW